MMKWLPEKASSTRIGTYLRWCSNGLLAAGMLVLGCYALIWGQARLYQAYQGWQLSARGVRRPPSSHSALAAQSLIGQLQIPRLGLSAVVVEGDDARTLRVAAGHIPGTALPGQSGNVAIAGHRDTFFRSLHNIRRNDTITLRTPWGAFDYRVESLEVVGPDDTAVLKASAQPSLTLVTCYPFSYIGSAPSRFVVRARQVSGSPSRKGKSSAAPA